MIIIDEIKIILKDASYTTIELLKIMIPISIIIKILDILGFIEIIGRALSPIMGIVGLPGDFGLVWATAMITNIYGGLIVFFSLSINNSYTVAQVTILSVMILVAHNLPIEARITQKAGVSICYMLSLRIIGAFVLGWLLSIFINTFNLFNTKSRILWTPGYENETYLYWFLGEIKNYFMIFLIILILISLIHILKKSGLINRFNNLISPLLKFLGMSKNAAPITIIGMTLGLAYGGGIIIKEAKSKNLSKKDIFLSLSLMGLSHSLIEDTLLMLTIGASLIAILFARLIFSILVLLILIQFINRISNRVFKKYFYRL